MRLREYATYTLSGQYRVTDFADVRRVTVLPPARLGAKIAGTFLARTPWRIA